MKKILVVDDTKNIRILLTKCLELEGFTVLTATDGLEALELFKHEKFDLAFLDIKMPHFSGTEVLKRIREQGVTIPVIIITAYATIKNAVECTQMGAVAYLQKPFTAEKVRSVLNEICVMPSKVAKNDIKENQFKQIEKLLDTGDFEKAIELLKLAISAEPTDSNIYCLFSRAYQGIGDIQNTEKFKKIYEILKNR